MNYCAAFAIKFSAVCGDNMMPNWWISWSMRWSKKTPTHQPWIAFVCSFYVISNKCYSQLLRKLITYYIHHTFHWKDIYALGVSKLVYLSKKIYLFGLQTLTIQGNVLTKKTNIKVTQCMEVEKNCTGPHISFITDLKADIYTIETRIIFDQTLFVSNHLTLYVYCFLLFR